jgi:hypothetical protein
LIGDKELTTDILTVAQFEQKWKVKIDVIVSAAENAMYSERLTRDGRKEHRKPGHGVEL